MANGVFSSVCFSGIGANSGLGRVISGASILLLKEVSPLLGVRIAERRTSSCHGVSCSRCLENLFSSKMKALGLLRGRKVRSPAERERIRNRRVPNLIRGLGWKSLASGRGVKEAS